MSLTIQQLVGEAKQQITEISLEDADQHLANKVCFIDVREPKEFEAGHVPGAINIPRGVLEFQVADNPVLANKSETFVLYCRSGGRSALATLNLSRMGFEGVLSLTGGFNAWKDSSRSVMTAENCQI